MPLQTLPYLLTGKFTMSNINFPACPATPKPTTSLTLFSNNIGFSSSNNCSFSNFGRKNLSLYLTNCSTKNHTHSDNTTDGSTVGFTTSSGDLPECHPKDSSETPSISDPTPSNAYSSRGLVFDLGQSGSWDENEVGSPVVKRFLSDDEERWYMWYHGRSAASVDSVGLAVSSNGVHWQRGKDAAGDSSSGVGAVMTCGVDWWAFDTKSIKPAEIMVMSSKKVKLSSAVYWLYYTGFSSEIVDLPQGLATQFSLLDSNDGFRSGLKSLPGLVISQDGRNWARIEGEHHSGALIDVGSEGEWDSLFIASPHVVYHNNGDLRMYYHSFDPKDGKFAIGLARSRDGIRWLKLGKIMGGGDGEGCFDEMGVLNCCVVGEKKDGNYLMAYEGVDKNGTRSIGLAISDDGLKDWKRIGDTPVLKACSDDGWDSKGVGSPCLVQMDGDEDQWRLYYRGVGVGCRTGIGMAVYEGGDLRCFKRWTGFHVI